VAEPTVRLRRKQRPDYGLIVSTGALLAMGLVIIYSISPVLSHKLLGEVSRNYFLYGQLTHISLGVVALLIAANIHYQVWQKYLPVFLIVAGLSLLLLMIPGVGVTKNGATRWVDLGIFSFQPAEILKFSLLLLLSKYYASLASDEIKSPRRMLWPTAGLLALVALFVMFLQRDLGTMLVIAAITISTFFAAGADIRQLATLIAIGLGGGVLSILIFPHRLARIATFLNPEQATSSTGYHLNQALIAIGSGGLLGLGIGKSIQVYGYLPESANDSIFAIIGETFGFIGCLAVLMLFGVLIQRILKVASQAEDKFGQLLAVGVAVWIGSQAIVNIGAMLGLIPLTGIPLPFLSYGGTSLISILFTLGIVINISKYQKRRSEHAHTTFRRRQRRPHYTHQSGSRRLSGF